MTAKFIPTFSSVTIPQIEGLAADARAYLFDTLSVTSSRTFSRSLEMSRSTLSDTTGQLMDKVASLRNPVSPSLLSFAPSAVTIEERLFDATSAVKMLTAQVAMHMTREWRDKLFIQIESLHDLDEWDTDDKPVERSSFASFLKLILYIKPQRHPGLGLSYEGHLIAAWTAGKDRLTIEFLAKDRVHWVLTRDLGGESERAAGQTVVSRLYECLLPYNPKSWFSYE